MDPGGLDEEMFLIGGTYIVNGPPPDDEWCFSGVAEFIALIVVVIVFLCILYIL